jgi:hypothetical protein
LCKQHSNPPRSTNTAANASTEVFATLTLTTSIKKYWMVVNSNASSGDWFIDCGCTTHIADHRSMFITYTQYPPSTKLVKGYIRVTLFASGYEGVRLIWQVPDGNMETIRLQEVAYLPGSFNLNLQSQIMGKDVKVEPVNHYGLNHYSHHGKLIATAPQVYGLFMLDRTFDRPPESTKYTDIDDSCLLAL